MKNSKIRISLNRTKRFLKKNYNKSIFYIENIVNNNDYNQFKHNVDNFNAKNNFVDFFLSNNQ